ncbi:hypothetical protein C6361_28520 [Plantactinospora sp. BC1]|nr:hypothetical protein C6361_28520 [Plantactinospora sp. BC1]
MVRARRVGAVVVGGRVLRAAVGRGVGVGGGVGVASVGLGAADEGSVAGTPSDHCGRSTPPPAQAAERVRTTAHATASAASDRVRRKLRTVTMIPSVVLAPFRGISRP